MHWLKVLSLPLVTWLVVPGCGGDTGSPGRPKGCTVSGKVHEHGSSFPSPDGCSTCKCENGSAACPTIDCLAACGRTTGKTCRPGEYCMFLAGCGASQAGGCMPQPDACPDNYAPVCGCDEKTYGNACSAAAAGISVARDGQCSGVVQESCGGRLGDTCSSSQYCAYENGDCGYADGTSVCKPRPQSCDAIYDPVCGCDAKTHSSPCAAAMAGVGWLKKGDC